MTIRSGLSAIFLGCVACATAPVPPPDGVYNALAQDERFETFVRLLDETKVKEELAEGGPFLVFAPTDEAFNKLPQGALDRMRRVSGGDWLRQEIRFHIARGEKTAAELRRTDELATLAGLAVPLQSQGDRLLIGNAVVTGTIAAADGVIHPLDQVIQVPPAILLEKDKDKGKKRRRIQPDQWYW